MVKDLPLERVFTTGCQSTDDSEQLTANLPLVKFVKFESEPAPDIAADPDFECEKDAGKVTDGTDLRGDRLIGLGGSTAGEEWKPGSLSPVAGAV